MGESVPYGEAAAIIRELIKDIGSHYSAARLSWAYVIDLPGIMATIHAEAYLNAHRDDKKQPKPYALPRPWDTTKPATVVSDEERAALVERLKRRSALRDR